MRSNHSGFVQHTNFQLVRIYPKGSRTDSSNFHPVPFWNAGCQIGTFITIIIFRIFLTKRNRVNKEIIFVVALNYQTSGKYKSINDTFFQFNGNCGYVLKPAILRDPKRSDIKEARSKV